MNNIHFLNNLIEKNELDLTLKILASIFQNHNQIHNQILVNQCRLAEVNRWHNTGTRDKHTIKEYNSIIVGTLSIMETYQKECNALAIPDFGLIKQVITGYEEALWNFVRLLGQKRGYEYFLETYPESFFVPFAKRYIKDIELDAFGSIVVQLTADKQERFNLHQFDDFGQFCDVIFGYVYPFVEENVYGKAWKLERSDKNSTNFIKHGREITDNYFAPHVKDTRSLSELGIHTGAVLRVKKFPGNELIDAKIYTDTIQQYQEYVCEEASKIPDLPADMRTKIQEQLEKTRGAFVCKRVDLGKELGPQGCLTVVAPPYYVSRHIPRYSTYQDAINGQAVIRPVFSFPWIRILLLYLSGLFIFWFLFLSNINISKHIEYILYFFLMLLVAILLIAWRKKIFK